MTIKGGIFVKQKNNVDQYTLNMQRLNTWFKDYACFEKIDLNTACNLYLNMLNQSPDGFDKDINDRIILGTMWVVYDFLRKSILTTFQIDLFSFDDVISATVELFAEKIENGELLTCYTCKDLLCSDDISKVLAKVNPLLDDWKDSNGFKNYKKVSDVLYYYIMFRTRCKEDDFDNFVLYLEIDANLDLNEKFLRNIALCYKDLQRFYSEFTNFGTNEKFVKKLSNRAITSLLPVVFSSIKEKTVFERDSLYLKDNFFESLENEERIKLIENIFSKNICNLDIIQQVILSKRLGYDIVEGAGAFEPMSYKEISADLGITRARVKRQEVKALKKVRETLSKEK